MAGEPQPTYYVVFAESTFSSWEDVRRQAGAALQQHLAQSRRLHEEGKVLMSGVFLDHPGEPVTTMAVLTSREDAEAYMRDDPFVAQGMVRRWYVREWANMFYTPPPGNR